MLLYPMNLKGIRCWCLDLTAPRPPDAGDADAACVYALVVPLAPVAVYIGSTKDLRGRVGQHLSRARSALRRGRGPHRAARTGAQRLLQRVISGRSALLVLRLERRRPGAPDSLRTLELAWMIVAARAALALQRRRGPHIEWPGDPSRLRRAFELARQRRWPVLWIQALKPLCQNRTLPEAPPPRRRRPRAADHPPATPGQRGGFGRENGKARPRRPAPPGPAKKTSRGKKRAPQPPPFRRRGA